MWQIHWVLALIPDSFFLWITYLLIAVGVGLYVASKLVTWIPLISQYKLPAELVGVVLLVAGSYLFGSHGTEMAWRERVKELEAKVAVAEAESKVVNTEVKEKIVERVRVVKETQVVIQEKLRDVQVTVDSQCKIHPKVIDILNEAALNPGAKK